MPIPRRASKTNSSAPRLQALIDDYRPLAGVPDEFLRADGRPHDHWQRFLEGLTELSSSEIERRFADCDQHIRDSGVSYRAWGDADENALAPEREWPLSHVPLVLPNSEWHEIVAGVAQRAR